METVALYAGSFDPFTNGHLNIVREASKVFDRVFVCLAVNSEKKRTFSECVMASAISACLKRENLDNCMVISNDGLIADFCKSKNIQYLVRGLRNTTDYLYEENIAKFNYELNPELRTIYFRAETGIISSSMIRELLKYNKEVEKYLPKEVYNIILENKE